MSRPDIRELIYNMLQMKFYICCKTLSNGILIQKSGCKNQKPRKFDFACQICTCQLLVYPKELQWLIATDVCYSDMETITNIDYQWVRNILNKIDTKQKKLKKVVSRLLKLITWEISQNYLKVLDLFQWKLNDYVLSKSTKLLKF